MESSATVVPVSTTPESREARDEDFRSALEAAKLQALYNFAYGLSHEINNPLANITTRAQTLLVDEKNPERRRKLATIVQQAFRAHEMIADLMLFARPPAIRAESADLADLADTVVAEMQEQARDQGTSLIRTGVPSPLLAHIDRIQIAVALKAIIQNSLEAVREGGSVEVSAEIGTGSAEHGIVPSPHFSTSASDAPRSALRAPSLILSVSDTGPGIPPHIRPHIFDPFFSGREAGRGLGLGLSKAWRIINLHGGRIEVESAAGKGAKFTIALPAS
jgi:signal transduction histidine kinase